jgi:hypothetical protein
MKKRCLFVVLVLLAAVSAFAQRAEDFNIALNDAKDGVVIKGYTGTAAVVIIPAQFEGYPVREIGAEAFRAKAGLSSVTIPAGVTKISAAAFFKCSNLKTVVIPEGVTEIGPSAFAGCAALTAIALPASIQKFGESAFEFCVNLITVTIPDSVEQIEFDSYTFRNCPKLNLATQAALRKRGYQP